MRITEYRRQDTERRRPGYLVIRLWGSEYQETMLWISNVQCRIYKVKNPRHPRNQRLKKQTQFSGLWLDILHENRVHSWCLFIEKCTEMHINYQKFTKTYKKWPLSCPSRYPVKASLKKQSQIWWGEPPACRFDAWDCRGPSGLAMTAVYLF